MSDTARPLPSVLIYDRVDANRRLSRWLLVLFVAGTLPAALYVSAYASVWVIMLTPLMAVLEGSEARAIPVFGVVTVIVGHALLAVALWRYRRAPQAILHRVGARPIREADEDFRRAVASLCIGAGLPMPALHVCETAVPNAFVVGHSPEDSALVVSRGLLDALDRLELEGVLAHELAHIGNEDVRLNTTLAGMLRTFVLPLPIRVLLWLTVLPAVAMLLDASEFGFDRGYRMLFAGQVAVTVWVLAWPTLGKLLQHALSRKRELLADAQAVLLTRYPDGLARALLKLERLNAGTGPFASPQVAHLMIMGRKPLFAAFATHPEVSTRVAALAAMGATGEASLRGQVAATTPRPPRTSSSAPTSPSASPSDAVASRSSALVRVTSIGLGATVGYLVLVVVIAVAARLPAAQWTGYLSFASFGGFVLAGWLGARSSARSTWAQRAPPVLRRTMVALLLLFIGMPVLMMLFAIDMLSQEAASRAFCAPQDSAIAGPDPCGLAVGLLVGALWIPVGGALGVFHDRFLGFAARQFTSAWVARPANDDALPDSDMTRQHAPAVEPDTTGKSGGTPEVCTACGGASPEGSERCQWCGAPLQGTHGR